MVGIKTPNIKYFVAHPAKQEVRMEQIVSEDFILYDIKLDFAAKTLSFFLESDEASLSPVVLRKAYQAFAVKYSPDKFGFLVYGSERNRREKQT